MCLKCNVITNKAYSVVKSITWYEYRDVLRQGSGQNVDQLSQHVEATLTGFHTLLLQLLVKSFHDHGDLERARDIHRDRERVSDHQLLPVSCGYRAGC